MSDKLHNPLPSNVIITPPNPERAFGLRLSAIPHPLISDLVLFNLANVPPCEYVTHEHMHPFHQLDIVLDKWVEHHIEGWPDNRLNRGDAILIPPLVRHGMFASDGFRHASFKIFVQSRAARQLGDLPFLFKVSKRSIALLEDIERRSRDERDFVDQQVMAAGAVCLLDAVDAAPPDSVGRSDADAFRRLIRPVLERLAEAPYTGISVADMARACHMSVDHFSKRFRNTMNQTPQAFLIDTRMRIAATDLLAEPPLAIKQVADRAGYSSSQTFTRAFTAAMGISPDAFRKASRQLDDHSNPHRAALH